MNNYLKKINWKDFGVVFGFIFLCIVISIASPNFMTQRNILNLLRQSSIIGVIATGMTFVIISGNFDISVGAVAALSGSIAMKLISMGQNVFVSVLIAILVSLVVGFDGSIDGLNAVKDGSIDGTTYMSAVEEGRVAIETAVKFLNGEKVGPVTEIKQVEVNKENVDQFEGEW